MKHKNQKHFNRTRHVNGTQPELAVVVPVYNEEEDIERCLAALSNQTVDSKQYSIIVVDGGSTDRTLEILRKFMTQHTDNMPEIILLDNPKRSVPHARNIAMGALPDSVRFVLEHIGHAFVKEDYLELRLKAWKDAEEIFGEKLAGLGAKVLPDSSPSNRREVWIESAINSWLGHSDGQFAKFDKLETTKTPAFVLHRRACIEELGGWDTRFITSQDSEFSMRILNAGYILARSPMTMIQMKKRSTLSQWWRMGHRYGFWRTKLIQKYPSRARFAEFLPLIGLFLTIALFLTNNSYSMLPIVSYFGVLIIEGLSQSIRFRSLSVLLGCPLCLVLLHTSFTIGLTDGLIRKGSFARDR